MSCARCRHKSAIAIAISVSCPNNYVDALSSTGKATKPSDDKSSFFPPLTAEQPAVAETVVVAVPSSGEFVGRISSAVSNIGGLAPYYDLLCGFFHVFIFLYAII